MRVLVFGGRNFNNRKLAFAVLDAFHEKFPITTVISGTAAGADRMGEEWAEGNSISVERYPAPWSSYGKRAGPIRNQRMVDIGRPDSAIGFPGGRGTSDMIERLKKAEIPRLIVDIRRAGSPPASPGAPLDDEKAG